MHDFFDGFQLSLLTNLIQRCLRSIHTRPEVSLGKAALKICSKCTGGHPRWSVISVMLQSNFIKIALRHECFPVNLLHIFRTSFPRNTSGWLLLKIIIFFLIGEEKTVSFGPLSSFDRQVKTHYLSGIELTYNNY